MGFRGVQAYMATIFFSHAALDDQIASDVEAWLKSEGFTDIFLDHDSIDGGDKWAEALRQSARACRVVLSLVTPNWLASRECYPEYRMGWLMGKRSVPLLLLEDEGKLNTEAALRLQRILTEDQGVDLTPFLTPYRRLDFTRDAVRANQIRQGLRAAGALTAVGLDPGAFNSDRRIRAAPFPGLASFEDEDADAALFFGRSREISEALEELRAMRAGGDNRVFMVFGASGAGKSSLLKAGVIPRLKREAQAWLPLRVFRPGGDPLLNFAEAIARTLYDHGQTEAHGSLRRTLEAAWRTDRVEEALAAIAERLRSAAGRPDATLLIAVDQAEELARAAGPSGDALAAYLRAALNSGPVWRAAFTIRTDSFPELQAHPRFQGLEARGYDLRSLPNHRYSEVVEGPAKRYSVEIEHGLVDQLIEEAPSKDALPLLAFTMQRLWDLFAADGKITLADYAAMGGLSGVVGDAAERALAGQGQVEAQSSRPTASKLQDQLGALTFVPRLVELNDEGTPLRRVANWAEFDEPAQALLERFADWRLVVKKNDAGTVEVAHEVLFRAWPRLAKWLEPELERLATVHAVMQATTAWDRAGRARDLLVHSGARLRRAKVILGSARYNSTFGPTERAYIAACARSTLTTKSIVAALIAMTLGSPLLFQAAVNEVSPLRISAFQALLTTGPFSEWSYNVLEGKTDRLSNQVVLEFSEWIYSDPDGGWYLGQALSSGAPIDERGVATALQFLSDTYDPACSCWRERTYPDQARHTIATYWATRALLENGVALPSDLISGILQSQHPDGSWSLQADLGEGNATGPTAFSMLTLQNLVRHGLSDQQLNESYVALRSARNWLVASASPNGQWSGYPISNPSLENRGISALSVFALLDSFPHDPEVQALARRWRIFEPPQDSLSYRVLRNLVLLLPQGCRDVTPLGM